VEAEVVETSGIPEDRMNIHKNARLTPSGRERIVRQVESGQAPKAVARGWHPLQAIELGMDPRDYPADALTLHYSFVDGFYMAYGTEPAIGEKSEGLAFALTGVVDNLRTLVISFAGTDQTADMLSYADRGRIAGARGFGRPHPAAVRGPGRNQQRPRGLPRVSANQPSRKPKNASTTTNMTLRAVAQRNARPASNARSSWWCAVIGH
jgi:hypothetical protein